MANTTFDFAGEGLSSTNTYITANSLTSTATFSGMTFNNSRSSGTFRYNVWASTETSLSWSFICASGARSGAGFTKEDAGINKIIWGAGNPGTGTLYTWWGSADTNWANGSNWSPTPSSCNGSTLGSSDSALIVTTATVMPILTSAVTISSLTINSGTAMVTLNGFNLTLSSFTNAGNFLFKGSEQVSTAPNNLAGSSVTYTGITTNLPFLSTWTYRNAVINGTGTFTTNGNTSVNGQLNINAGTLAFSRVVTSTITMVGGNITVNAGGTLDMGTASTPLSASSATLILAYGQTAGQYGLIVNNGGNMLVFGNPTVSVTTPAKNVVVRSSGTTIASNTAYIQNLVQNSTSFALSYGEFDYLGSNVSNSVSGITFDGSGVKGSISSSTIQSGYYGVLLNQASNITLSWNNILSNAVGIFLYQDSNNTLLGNQVSANTASGIDFYTSVGNVFANNNSYSNPGHGIDFYGSANNNTGVSNYSWSNQFNMYASLRSATFMLKGVSVIPRRLFRVLWSMKSIQTIPTAHSNSNIPGWLWIICSLTAAPVRSRSFPITRITTPEPYAFMAITP